MGVRGWRPPVLVPAATLYRCAELPRVDVPGSAQPRLLERLPRARRDGGHVRLRAGDRRARRGARARPARAAPAQRRRPDQASGQPYTRSKRCARRSTAPPSSPAGTGATALARRRTRDGRVRGLGAACQIWWGGGGPPAHALVRMGADGLATVVTGMQDIGTGARRPSRAGRRRGARPPARPRARRDAARRATASTRPSRPARRRRPRSAPAVRGGGRRGARRSCCSLASDLFEVAADDLELVDGEFRIARRRAAPAAGRGDRQARQRAAGRHRLARPEPRGHADPDVRLPDRAGRGRRGDGRDRGRAPHRRARHRPRREPARRLEPGRGRRPAGARLRAEEERVVDPDHRHGRQREPRGLQAADDRRLPGDRRRASSTRPTEPLDDRASRASASRRSCRPRPPSRTPSPPRTGVRAARGAADAAPLARGARRDGVRTAAPGDSLDEALGLLPRGGALALAGGTDLNAAHPARQAARRRADRPAPRAAVGHRARTATAPDRRRHAARGDRARPARRRALRGAAQAARRGGVAPAAQRRHASAATSPSTSAAGTTAIPT